MHSADTEKATLTPGPRKRWLMAVACLCIVLMAILLPKPHTTAPSANASADSTSTSNSRFERTVRTAAIRRGVNETNKSPEEIVAAKVAHLGHSRHELVRRISQRTGKPIPAEVEAFFDAVEAGNWELIQARWKPLAVKSGQYAYSTNAWEDLNPFWPAILDAYGVAEQAHNWPAQKLLDYGNAILDSLRPGMVYVGGTDEGRWIPTLLNESSDGENHVVLTQNALADARYLDFLNELYGGKIQTLTHEDSQRAFQEYTADAQKRLEHDQQFPDEPKQVRPGEVIKMENGSVQVSGAAGVMAVNEKLLQTLMQKNPDLSFAMQESTPLTGLYASAVPRGPLMELLQSEMNVGFNKDQAAQSVDYWRTATQELLANPDPAALETPLRAYSHNVDSTANLLAAHNFSAEAEQAYKLSSQLWPGNPEPIAGLANVYSRTSRAAEARQLLDDFGRKYPAQLAAAQAIWTARSPLPPATPAR